MEDLLSLLWFGCYVLLIVVVIHKYFTWNFYYFWEQGIPGPRPIPVFGNYWKIWKRNSPSLEIQQYQKYGKLYGIFEGRKPNLVVGDPKIIRKILVDDFAHFENRGKSTGNSYIKFTLPTLTSKKWSLIREGTSAMYSPHCVQAMTNLIEPIAEEMTRFVQTKVDAGMQKIDLRDLATTYVIDIVANCAFGTKLDTFTSSQPSQFYQELIAIFSKPKPITPAFVFGQLYPRLGRLMPRPNGFQFFATFAKGILSSRRQRSHTAPKRGDFVDALLEAGNASNLSDAILVDQMLQFLITGIEPVAISIAYALNALAINREVQTKLRTEIRSELKKEADFPVAFDLENLPYLDQCVDETLRMFPPALRLERRCNRSIAYPGAKCHKGTLVSVPVYAIHHDPEIYPQPDVFEPNRFSAGEKQKRDPMTFLLFGDGNRACIGSTFAKTQIKFALVHLVNNFEFFRVFETSDMPECSPTGFPPMLTPVKVIVGIRKV